MATLMFSVTTALQCRFKVAVIPDKTILRTFYSSISSYVSFGDNEQTNEIQRKDATTPLLGLLLNSQLWGTRSNEQTIEIARKEATTLLGILLNSQLYGNS